MVGELGDLYVAGEPEPMLSKAFIAPYAQEVMVNSWCFLCDARAASRRPAHTFGAASYAILTTCTFSSFFLRPVATLDIFDGAREGTRYNGVISNLFPPGCTLPSCIPRTKEGTRRPRRKGWDAFVFSDADSTHQSVPSPHLPFGRNAVWNSLTRAELIPLPPATFPPRELLALPHKKGNTESFLETEEMGPEQWSVSADFGQPQKSQWLCRISASWQACAWREHDRWGPKFHCPPGSCCSEVACKDGMCLGGWCAGVYSGLCVFTKSNYNAGTCTCNEFGNQCSGNAVCHTIDQENGGAYCTCAHNFLGDGKQCKPNPCQSNPCSPGTCAARGGSYVCDCPSSTHERTETDQPACVAKKNPCITDPCGPLGIVDSCLNFEKGYECICKEGYISEAGVCEKVDWCKGDPCGPPKAVHSCVSVGLEFKCSCQRGYVRLHDADGLEYCEKDFCADNPCGSPELVQSCSNRPRQRETDESSHPSPRYSCLCASTAELKFVGPTGEGRCELADPCKNDPCGPPEAVEQCFVEGVSYGCACKTGYTVQLTGEAGLHKCVAGDPCVMQACGPDDLVEHCTTDGKTYSCLCSADGFLSLERSGLPVCRSRALCETNCGPTAGLKQCTPKEGSYKCVCKEGFLLKYLKGAKACMTGDPCAVNPCGSPTAVAECRREEYGYSCICERGFELRTRSDDTQLCAVPQSCVGDPCGSSVAVELCIPGKQTYSCKCRDPYVSREFNGRKRCALSTEADESEDSTFPGDKPDETESQKDSTALLAGIAVGGVILVCGAYAAIVYVKKRQEPQEDSWTAVREPIPDFFLGRESYPFEEARAAPVHFGQMQDTTVPHSPSAWR